MARLVEAPQPEHMLDDWFDAKLVARLAAASATTFAELLALIRARRLRWFRAAQRLAGYTPRAARRVVTRTLERLIDQLPDLWHVSLQSTAIYVTAEQKRARPECARYHTRTAGAAGGSIATGPMVERSRGTRSHARS
ncbi:phage integrase family protein [Burkholderia diffusa]|uniref:phage integrase family protein n=1 Tax=Burkholderia diffusa TaxID=488732 RepID=UPI0030B81B51